jgi:hypothetical protein
MSNYSKSKKIQRLPVCENRKRPGNSKNNKNCKNLPNKTKNTPSPKPTATKKTNPSYEPF